MTDFAPDELSDPQIWLEGRPTPRQKAKPLGVEYLRQQIAEIRAMPTPDECRRLRTECGLSRVEMAAAVGVSQTAIHLWETGKRSPQGELRKRYTEALAVLREALAD